MSILQCAKRLSSEIEVLAAAVTRDGKRPDNCEYPWEGVGAELRIPLDWSFAPSGFAGAASGPKCAQAHPRCNRPFRGLSPSILCAGFVFFRTLIMVACAYCDHPLVCEGCGEIYVPPSEAFYQALSRPEVPITCNTCGAVLTCHWCKTPYDGLASESDDNGDYET